MKSKISIITMLAMILLVSAVSVSAYTITGNVRSIDTGAIIGAVVEVRDPASVLIVTTNTNSNGDYSATTPDISGLYNVRIIAAGFHTQNQSTYLPSHPTVDFPSMAHGALVTLSGVVKDQASALIPGATITATRVGVGGGVIGITQSVAGGAYSLTIINDTAYTVSAAKSGYISDIDSLPTVNGNTTHDFVLNQTPTTGTVNGYVMNISGAMIANAVVSVKLAGGTVATATTNGVGYYTITIDGRTYNMTAVADHYNRAQQNNVVIANGGTVQVNFTLGATCPQQVSYSSWSSCVSKHQSRTVTYTNYQNICGNPYTTTQTQSCGSSGGGGGGGGSGGAGTVVYQTTNIKCPGDISQLTSVVKGDKVIITYMDGKYEFNIVDVTPDFIDLKIFPVPSISLRIKTSESELVDLDKDGYDDVRVAVNSINAIEKKASMRFTCISGQLSEPKEEDETEPTEEVEETTTPVLQNIKEGVLNILSSVSTKEKTSPFIGIAIICLIIILGLLIYMGIRKLRNR